MRKTIFLTSFYPIELSRDEVWPPQDLENTNTKLNIIKNAMVKSKLKSRYMHSTYVHLPITFYKIAVADTKCQK